MKKTITLYTVSYNNYWEKYGEQWSYFINNLNTKPDEIIVVSDIPINLSCLNYINVKNIISPVVNGRRMVSHYRNLAVSDSTSDWIISADLDDIYNDIFLDNIPEDSDIHAFKFIDHQSRVMYSPDQDCLNERVSGTSQTNLISCTSAIKKHVFNILKYEDNVAEDKVFYAMASQLNLNLSYDGPSFPPRFEYTGSNAWENGVNAQRLSYDEFARSTQIYTQNIVNGGSSVYAFWFSGEMSENRKRCLDILYRSCKTLHLLDYEGFYKFEHQDLPIHKGFKYLSDIHKSDYARAYMMYFYGGGYSDIKANDFDWSPYFKKLFSSKYDVIGYREKNDWGVSRFNDSVELDSYIKENYNKFIGNGHYIFKPKTYIAYQWITAIHSLMDERYEELEQNPSLNGQDMGPLYPFEWNEICGRIFHRLQYENNLEACIAEMPYVMNKNYK